MEQNLVPNTPPADVGLTQEQADVLERNAQDAHAPNTRIAYASQWRTFAAWCKSRGVPALPAAPELVALYVTARADSGIKPASLRLAVSAISKAHRLVGGASPCITSPVRDALRAAARRYAEAGGRVKQAAALDTSALAAIRATAHLPRLGRGGSLESAEAAAVRGHVDVALCSLMSDAGLRRSEVAALTWADVWADADGSGRVRIARSKTDVEGVGATVWCSAQTLAAVLVLKPNSAADIDAVFGLSERQIARRIQAAARAAGIEGASGHSGRVGMAHRLARSGAPIDAALRQGRWKATGQYVHYAKQVDAGHVAQWMTE